jgi:hypothetical protein
LIAGFGLAGTAALAGAAAPPVFEALRWTAPGAELVVLSSQPESCVDYRYNPDIGEDGSTISTGEALFNAPTLLGGQAAKAGLSCASCHVNGTDNPHFLLAGASDKPGTADVSNSFFSAARGNGRFDPIPIPNLATPGKVSRDPATRALEPFVRALIVEEFSGQEPSPATLEALTAYVRAIRPCKYRTKALAPRAIVNQLDLMVASIRGAHYMIDRKDRQGARLAIASARHQLGLISERYAGPALSKERNMLLLVSRELQRISEIEDMPKMARELVQWNTAFMDKAIVKLGRKRAQSLYNPALLAKQFPPTSVTPSIR